MQPVLSFCYGLQQAAAPAQQPACLLSLLSLVWAAVAESIAQLAAKEAGAVENEDFEEAASLSARLDATKQELEATQRALHAAEDECARLVRQGRVL